jgi:hypothetical protein
MIDDDERGVCTGASHAISTSSMDVEQSGEDVNEVVWERKLGVEQAPMIASLLPVKSRFCRLAAVMIGSRSLPVQEPFGYLVTLQYGPSPFFCGVDLLIGSWEPVHILKA